MRSIQDMSYDAWFESMISDHEVTSPEVTTETVEDQRRALEYLVRFLRSLDQDLGLSSGQLAETLEWVLEDCVFGIRDERLEVELRVAAIEAQSMIFEHAFSATCDHPDSPSELCVLCRRWWIAYPATFNAPELAEAFVDVLLGQLASPSSAVRSSGVEGIAEWFARGGWAERGSRPRDVERLLPALRSLARGDTLESNRDTASWVLDELHERYDFGPEDGAD